MACILLKEVNVSFQLPAWQNIFCLPNIHRQNETTTFKIKKGGEEDRGQMSEDRDQESEGSKE